MYCTECGSGGSGKFCAQCGTALTPPPSSHSGERQSPTSASREKGPVDWTHEYRYQSLIEIPEVRARIEDAAARARAPLSLEDFLQLGEKVVGPLVPGIPLSKVTLLSRPIADRLGIRTGKTHEEVIPSPIGQVLSGILVALAEAGQKVRRVQQAEDGCVLQADLPSDLWSGAGELTLEISRDQSQTRVKGTTRIPGQMFDWGKSRRCLNSLFSKLKQSLASPSSGRQ